MFNDQYGDSHNVGLASIIDLSSLTAVERNIRGLAVHCFYKDHFYATSKQENVLLKFNPREQDDQGKVLLKLEFVTDEELKIKVSRLGHFMVVGSKLDDPVERVLWRRSEDLVV